MDYDLRDWARREPQRIALEFETRPSVSYGELENMANRFAQLFRSLGLQRGDHVSALLGNGPEIVALCWGGWRCGLYVTPVAHTLAPPEVAYILQDSDAKAVVADAAYDARLSAVPAELPRFALGGLPGWTDLASALAAQPDTPIDDEMPGAVMLYSSGTTGAPKGIWRPLPDPASGREGPPSFAKDVMEIFGIDSDTRYLAPAPMYHAAPLRWSLTVTAAGGTAVIMERFDAARALDLVEARHITLTQWVPTMFRRMLALPEERRRAFAPAHHKVAWHAAAPCPPELKRRMIDWWGPILKEYYSGTESVGMTKLDTAEWLRFPGSVGRACKGELHILGDDWQELPPGVEGRVYFDPPSRFEYYKAPEKTAAKTSPQGWQTFGEVGYVNAEGYLFLTDRQDDMICSGGVNIYPQEIEHAIERLPEVMECCVAPIPDVDFGERPVAFVQPSRSAPDAGALIDLVRSHCLRELGRTKQPVEFRVLAELPRSDAGKTLRRVLRAQLAAEVAARKSAAAPAG